MSELQSSIRKAEPGKPHEASFKPHPLLRSGHLMTILPAFVPRSFSLFRQKAERRIFQVESHTGLLSYCNFHDDNLERFTAVLLHGLEGSSESSTMLGIAEKAFNIGMNVIRLNMRNCGGSMHLTPTLYNAGLSRDIVSVCRELVEKDKRKNLLLAGYSLGGNIVLNASVEAKELGAVKGVVAVSPSIDLHLCIDAIERPENAIYHHWFLRTLKQKIVLKAADHPHLYDVAPLRKVRTIREFDGLYTAPDGGYGTADNYYSTASAYKSLPYISVPSLIITAKDDPIVPFESFSAERMTNVNVRLVATAHGGHGGFFQARKEGRRGFDQHWAENRVVQFFEEVISAQK